MLQDVLLLIDKIVIYESNKTVGITMIVLLLPKLVSIYI